MIAHWELKHNWWEEDFRFEVTQLEFYKELLIRNPDGETGDLLRETVRLILKRIDNLQREYKKIYGTRFNLRRLDV